VETGAGGVRRPLVPILLIGGFGYEDLRHWPLGAVNHWFRPSFRSGRCGPARRRRRQLPTLQFGTPAGDRYRISLALAGFSPDEIAITAEQNLLTIEGGKADKGQRHFLYRSISSRPFKRQFNLGDYVRVGEAQFDNGLLQVELVRELPEAMKPRRIPIDNLGADAQQLEPRAA
jgi:molecular chaperone IbpA